MSYSLRPRDKLKPPERLGYENDEEVDVQPVPNSADHNIASNIQQLSLEDPINRTLAANSHTLSHSLLNSPFSPFPLFADTAPKATINPGILSSSDSPQQGTKETGSLCPNPASLSGEARGVFLMPEAIMVGRGMGGAQSQLEPKRYAAGLSNLICLRCGETGHMMNDIAEDGLMKCRKRRAEIEGLIQKQAHYPPDSVITPLPHENSNQNWFRPTTAEEEYKQPTPPKTREAYIEALERENLQLPIWKANFFDMYEKLQQGGSLDEFPYQLGCTRLSRLHEADMRISNKAKPAAGTDRTNVADTEASSLWQDTFVPTRGFGPAVSKPLTSTSAEGVRKPGPSKNRQMSGAASGMGGATAVECVEASSCVRQGGEISEARMEEHSCDTS